MAVTLSCVPLMKPLLRIRRHRRQPTRVIVAGNSMQQRTHRYDPDYAGRLKLRPDMVEHRAEISAAARDGGGRESSIITVPERSYDSSGTNWKGKKGGREGEQGAEITVNKQWKVTRDAGEWTQILGGR